MNLPTAFFLCLGLHLSAAELYTTDFEAFNIGDNQWAGTEGWFSNDTTSGAQAIDNNLIIGGGLGKTASIGFKQPDNLTTKVFRPIPHNPATTGIPVIEVDTLLGIEDSTNGRRDDFYLSIYNASGDYLASILFDNQSPTGTGSTFGIWRDDGVQRFDTRIEFIHGELFNLYARIDLEANTWSADIDGVPLFTNVAFTATSETVNLGFIAFEWQLSSEFLIGFGNNYLLVADISVRSVPLGTEPFTATIGTDADGRHTISWPADPGFVYQVEYSDHLDTWLTDLPNSEFAAGIVPETMSFTDPAPDTPSQRYYRVRRTEAP